jgi:hypothetical protein
MLMKIHNYEDIAAMESEVCRLLHCEAGRTPQYATTVSYFQFRSRVIQMVSDLMDKENVGAMSCASVKIYLPQGLSVRCSLDGSCVLASIEWDSCVYEAKKETEKNHVNKKRREMCFN